MTIVFLLSAQTARTCYDHCCCQYNYEKHAPRVSQVIAAVAQVSCKHGLWLVARVNKKQKTCPTSHFKCLFPLYTYPSYVGGIQIILKSQKSQSIIRTHMYRIIDWDFFMAMLLNRPYYLFYSDALPAEPNNSIFSLTVALIASAPGASNLRGS